MYRLPLLFLAITLAPALAQTSTGKLTIDFIDVEGGQATLFVPPGGQSLLIDTGWSGHDYRDADRIAAAAHRAGLSRIDFVLITHYHIDHVGGVEQLLARIPVGTFIDHGPNRETGDPGVVNNYTQYLNILATNPVKEIVVHPGEKLPIPGLDVRVISTDGNVITAPLSVAGAPNPSCKSSEPLPADTTENSRSVGVEITFGKLKMIDLGDLTRDKELQLMCPVNKVGSVDILIVSHHGSNQSSSPALVHALHPRVAIMDNGATKGGSPVTFQTLASAPGLQQLWQLHYSNEAGETLNRPAKFIANLPGTDTGNSLQLTADRSGSFTILNSRTGSIESYPDVR